MPSRRRSHSFGRRADDRPGACGDSRPLRRRRCARVSAIEPAALVAAIRRIGSTMRHAGCWRSAFAAASMWPFGPRMCPQWVLLQFATARIGAVLVTINPAYRPFELKYVLNQCDAKALVPDRRLQEIRLFRDAGRGLPGIGRRRAGPIAARPRFRGCAGSSRCAARRRPA